MSIAAPTSGAVSTCDLCDAHRSDASGLFRVLPPVFLSFGAVAAFHGQVSTIKCFEDNALVKEAVHSPGLGRVLVVDGGATLEQVAARLDMPARRLRERLAMAGVRFNDLVTDYRCRLAKELLLKTDERIEVIVERTGFSEPSTFYRAFKRWVGETPVEFRKRGKV